MVPISVRCLIILAIIDQLKTITFLNGYNTDVNDNVVDQQLTNVDPDDMPNIEVKGLSEETERKGTLDYKTLSVELTARIVSASIDNARNFMADITEAMRLGPALPSNVYQFLPADSPDLTPEQKDKTATKFTMAYEIKYRE